MGVAIKGLRHGLKIVQYCFIIDVNQYSLSVSLLKITVQLIFSKIFLLQGLLIGSIDLKNVEHVVVFCIKQPAPFLQENALKILYTYTFQLPIRANEKRLSKNL